MPLDQTSGLSEVRLLVPGLRCAGCMRTVERLVAEFPGVVSARVNLSQKRLKAQVDPAQVDAEGLAEMLVHAGYDARPHDPTVHGDTEDETARGLLLRIGVAGFAAMNVMLLSISVWSGADAAIRDLLHWVSALIALPAIAYAGQPFFAGAYTALRAGRINMDVPISLAIMLSAASSVFETSQSGAHAYFDAGVMLLFFLLVGRYLEHRTRHNAKSAAAELMALTGRQALRMLPDGGAECVNVETLVIGDEVLVAPGERVPADGRLCDGRTEIDRALITGESLPEPAIKGDLIHAGTLNLTGAIRVRVTTTGEATLLAEIGRMVDNAQRARGKYDRLADRAARLYAPGVHLLAGLAFAGWLWVTGDARLAVQIAVAVLIVTCPCALALAVPTVHTVASNLLFRNGIFLKNGDELERLAEIDTIVFDKTGTLTDGTPILIEGPSDDDPAWPVAAALASASRHPLSRVIAAEAQARGVRPVDLCDIREVPGHGLEALSAGRRVRLGRADWIAPSVGGDGVLVELQDGNLARFRFAERLRKDAEATCSDLVRKGYRLAILSGDGQTAVTRCANKLGVDHGLGGMLPGDKLVQVERLGADGHKVLMVGDGMNDSPVLAAAHASISPGAASDVAKAASGLVFTGESLSAVSLALRVADTARRRSLQSFAIALGYNAIAIPCAMLGLVTPLFAAVAMSASSMLVVLNALRMKERP